MFFRGFILCLLAAGAAKADWSVSEIDHDAYPTEILTETRAPASEMTDVGLPDGLIAIGTRDIARAWYEGPTRRYAHAILGDAIEAGALVIETTAGRRLSLTLPEHQVFEDRYPRIADLDGDGNDEIITIRSSAQGGGGVAVYGVRDGRLSERTAIPEIGTPNRWLNIAAVADLNADGALEIAFVRTPHIGGTLRVFTWDDGELRLLDELYGLSNHAIGSPEMRLSAIVMVEGAARLAIPDAARRALRIVGMEGDKLRDVAEIPLPGRIDKAIAVDGSAFIVGVADGRVYRVEKR